MAFTCLPAGGLGSALLPKNCAPFASTALLADSAVGSGKSSFLSPPRGGSDRKAVYLQRKATGVIQAKNLGAHKKPHARQTCRLPCCFKKGRPLIARPDQQNQSSEDDTDARETWRIQVVAMDEVQTESNAAENKEQMDWAKAWYPVAVVEDLDPKKPKGIMVLGRRLVLWRDKGKQWRCHLDCCPHRFAPLSEGRIHESGGLQCSYHGWVFGPQGNCTLIPQADADEQGSLKSKLACTVSFPLKEEAGLLWVWADEHSPEEAAQKSFPIDKTLTDPDFTYKWVYRELPYNWDTLVENVVDPSHVNFAHHKVQGKRENARPITFGSADPELGGFTVPGRGKMGKIDIPPVSFIPPASVVYQFKLPPKKEGQKPWEGSLISYGTPIAPGRVAIFACFPRNFLKLFVTLMPRWYDHVTVRNKVLDGDLILLQGQEVLSVQEGATLSKTLSDSSNGHSKDEHNRASEIGYRGLEDRRYFMPTKADRPIIAFRKWVAEYGNGGPKWPAGFRTTPDPNSQRPEVILDRYTQHTQHCAACMGAYKNVQRLQGLTKVGILSAVAAAAVFSARDQNLSQSLALLAVALAGATWGLQKLEQQFVYVGYDHSKS